MKQQSPWTYPALFFLFLFLFNLLRHSSDASTQVTNISAGFWGMWLVMAMAGYIATYISISRKPAGWLQGRWRILEAWLTLGAGVVVALWSVFAAWNSVWTGAQLVWLVVASDALFLGGYTLYLRRKSPRQRVTSMA